MWSMFVTGSFVNSQWPRGDYAQLVETLSSFREKISEKPDLCGWVLQHIDS